MATGVADYIGSLLRPDRRVDGSNLRSRRRLFAYPFQRPDRELVWAFNRAAGF
jgi:hypothetical protein